MHLDQYDRIRARITAEGLTPEIQTRLALFVCASKAANLPGLALAGMMGAPNPWLAAWPGIGAAPTGGAAIAWQFLNTQFFRESEALALLARVTHWSPDPTIYATTAPLLAPLYAEWARADAAAPGARPGIGALALGYAMLATIRLTPIFPTELAQDPFVVALARIEQENGRLLQTQIRLLKDGHAEIPLTERENIIAAKLRAVEAAFDHFLDTLAA